MLGLILKLFKHVLDSSITKENVTGTMQPIYEDEMQEYNEWKRAAIKTNVDSPGVKMFDVMAAVNPAVLTKTQLITPPTILKGGKAKTSEVGTRGREK